MPAGGSMSQSLSATASIQEYSFLLSSPYRRIFTLSVTNDGAGVLQVQTVPAYGDWATINANESVSLSFTVAVLQALRYQGVSGATPNFRIIGTF